MSSTRLPGKVLMKVLNKEVLGHVLERLCFCRNIDKIIVATTNNEADDRIEKFVDNYEGNIKLFRGSEDNVLDRYYMAATEYEADMVIRVTSDSPLIDPHVIDFVISTAIKGAYDYASNSLSPTMPDGLDVECITYDVLTNVWKNAKQQNEREHVTSYVRTRTNQFKTANIYFEKNISSLCWAVDSTKDFLFVKSLSEYIDITNPENYNFEIILDLLKKVPLLHEINKSSVRDSKLIDQIPDIFSVHNSDYDNIMLKRQRMN